MALGKNFIFNRHFWAIENKGLMPSSGKNFIVRAQLVVVGAK
jgi:hypothetical protein